jgi:23S rRNA (guanosine2251-2'-O)-methyltransferase
MPDQNVTALDPYIRDRVLTLYGRKPVKEALLNSNLDCHALHLADSNRSGGIIEDISRLAGDRGIPIRWHDKKALSRISKNSKQDQGVALDIICPAFNSLTAYLESIDSGRTQRLLAVDGITNPQNLGMIIRSATAGNIDGLLLPKKGTAGLGPLVIKASVGTIFQAPILTCEELLPALKTCKEQGADICVLDANATTSLFEHSESAFTVYVLGNETEGVAGGTADIADTALSIPMRNNVESLNVAVTASLIAFSTYFDR